MTRRGFIGLISLGPPRSQIGDILTIFNGGSVPFVVREVASSPPRGTPNDANGNVGEGKRLFELPGDCYVHDIMDGEAVPVLNLHLSKGD